jgi:ABC-type enterobactin transport system permease subunit
LNSPTSAPARKLIAGMLGGGTAGSVAVMLLWILSAQHVDIPVPVAAAITGLVTAVFHFVVGYLVPPSPRDIIVTTFPTAVPFRGHTE